MTNFSLAYAPFLITDVIDWGSRVCLLISFPLAIVFSNNILNLKVKGVTPEFWIAPPIREHGRRKIRSADAKPQSSGRTQLLHLPLIKSGKGLLAASNSSEDKRMPHAPLDRSPHSGTDRYIPDAPVPDRGPRIGRDKATWQSTGRQYDLLLPGCL